MDENKKEIRRVIVEASLLNYMVQSAGASDLGLLASSHVRTHKSIWSLQRFMSDPPQEAMEVLELSIEDAKRILETFYESYPKVTEWLTKMKAMELPDLVLNGDRIVIDSIG